ncbi:unnamed protein product [Protopolystoma xenopodis]|uniref:Uncharacterized protein n=1 Tax=Protopolystoma xenopodis TaxID=117903 RepID=A0A3S5C4C7_9PLAT|nr:unnamed protein product [Protopolystoma xenopodis]
MRQDAEEGGLPRGRSESPKPGSVNGKEGEASEVRVSSDANLFAGGTGRRGEEGWPGGPINLGRQVSVQTSAPIDATSTCRIQSDQSTKTRHVGQEELDMLTCQVGR